MATTQEKQDRADHQLLQTIRNLLAENRGFPLTLEKIYASLPSPDEGDAWGKIKLYRKIVNAVRFLVVCEECVITMASVGEENGFAIMLPVEQE